MTPTPEPRRFRDTPLDGPGEPVDGAQAIREQSAEVSGKSASAPTAGFKAGGLSSPADSAALPAGPLGPESRDQTGPAARGFERGKIGAVTGSRGELGRDLGTDSAAEDSGSTGVPEERAGLPNPVGELLADSQGAPFPPAGDDLAPIRRKPRAPSVLSQPEVAWPAGLLVGALPAELVAGLGPRWLAPLLCAAAFLPLELFWARRGAARAGRAGVLGFGAGLLFIAIDGALRASAELPWAQRLGLWSGAEPLPGAPFSGWPIWFFPLSALLVGGLARVPTALPGRLLLAALLLDFGRQAGRGALVLADGSNGDLYLAWRGLGPLGALLAAAWVVAAASAYPADGRRGGQQQGAWWLLTGLLVALASLAPWSSAAG